MRQRLSLIALLLVPLAVDASDWQLVSRSQEKAISMDFSSVSISGAYRKAWIRNDFSVKQTLDQLSGKKYSSEKILFYFDCAGRTLVAPQDIKYTEPEGGGEVVYSVQWKFVTALLNDVVPDSEGELFLKIACASQGERDKIRALNRKTPLEGALRLLNGSLSSKGNN